MDAMIIAISQAEEEQDLSEDEEYEKALAAKLSIWKGRTPSSD